MRKSKAAKRRLDPSQLSSGTLGRLRFFSTMRKENQQCGFWMQHGTLGIGG